MAPWFLLFISPRLASEFRRPDPRIPYYSPDFRQICEVDSVKNRGGKIHQWIWYESGSLSYKTPRVLTHLRRWMSFINSIVSRAEFWLHDEAKPTSFYFLYFMSTLMQLFPSSTGSPPPTPGFPTVRKVSEISCATGVVCSNKGERT